MIDVLREESAGGGPEVNDLFYESLEELKTDPDFSTIMTEFDDALNGRKKYDDYRFVGWPLLF